MTEEKEIYSEEEKETLEELKKKPNSLKKQIKRLDEKVSEDRISLRHRVEFNAELIEILDEYRLGIFEYSEMSSGSSFEYPEISEEVENEMRKAWKEVLTEILYFLGHHAGILGIKSWGLKPNSSPQVILSAIDVRFQAITM